MDTGNVYFVCSCQFVVSASGDYAVHFRDPDKLVEWERIEQVVSCNVCGWIMESGQRVNVLVLFWCYFAVHRDSSVMRFHPVRFVSIHQEQVRVVGSGKYNSMHRNIFSLSQPRLHDVVMCIAGLACCIICHW